jgi:recombinational DNA repair protein (RecF pathway)
MNEQTKKCPVCGKPYKVYAFYAGDQSACPKCVREAESNTYHESVMEIYRRAKRQQQRQEEPQK